MNLPTTLGRAAASAFQPRTPPSLCYPLMIPQTKPAKFLNHLNTSLSNTTREQATKGVSVSLAQPSVTEPVNGRCCCDGDGEESEAAAVRLHHLVMEFQLLTEPIDRVKRLLDYAATLPLCDDSARLDSNRVTGCTSQKVWLEAGMDGCGRMRFRADSDSEITKGFCSCLIWVLDGAEPGEVLAIRAEDFAPMNVGLVAHSRVNTWHNVLISMQKRTKALLNRLDPFSLTSSAGGGGDDDLLRGNQARVEIL